MKFITLLILTLVSVTAHEVRLEINQKGEIRQVGTPQIWRTLTAEELQAYKQPNVPIPIYRNSETIKKIDFFHVIKVIESDSALVYTDGVLKEIELKTRVQSEPLFRFGLFFLITALLLMILGNISYYKNYKSIAFGATITTSIVAIIGHFIFPATAILSVILLSIAIYAVLLTLFIFEKNKLYWVLSILFYGLLIPSIVLG